jgi:hypothetical protein
MFFFLILINNFKLNIKIIFFYLLTIIDFLILKIIYTFFIYAFTKN